MSALRILHVVPYYEHAWAYGGIPRVATALARGLAGRGHQVTVCTTDACNQGARARKVHTPYSGPGTLDVRVFRNLSNRSGLPLAALRAGRPQPRGAVANGQDRRRPSPRLSQPSGGSGRSHPEPGAESRTSSLPMAPRRSSSAGCSPSRSSTRPPAADTSDDAARVLAVSEAERAQLRALGLPESRIAVLPNPIDLREFDPAPDGARFRERHELGDAPVVLLLGKLTPRKGADVALRAFEKLGRKDARLVIAGSDMGSGLAPGRPRRPERA